MFLSHIGAPYRKTIFSNRGFLLALVINLILTCYFSLYPDDITVGFMQMVVPPRDALLMFGVTLILIGLVNFIAGFFIEQFIVEYIIFKKLRYRFHNIEKSHKKFLSIENYLRLTTKWPPLSLYNNQENNSPSEDEGKGGACNSGASKGASTNDDNDDDTSPMSYAEISIEPVDEDAVMFDRNSSILNSFFERERQRLASINNRGTSSQGDAPDENDVFGSQTHMPIRRKNEQLKREYLELKLTDPAKPLMMNGYMAEGSFMSPNDNNNSSSGSANKKDDQEKIGVELHNLSSKI